MRSILALAFLGLTACGDKDDDGTGPTDARTADASLAMDAESSMDAEPMDADPIDAASVDAAEPDAGSPADQLPPTNSADLATWLAARTYTAWATESAKHDSAGPHFGDVRTYVNAELDASLAAGNTEHPMGAAAVKELYGMSGTTVRGWSVMVKTETGAGGARWWWFERFGSSTYASGQGETGCTGCHEDQSIDMFLSPYPLQ